MIHHFLGEPATIPCLCAARANTLTHVCMGHLWALDLRCTQRATCLGKQPHISPMHCSCYQQQDHPPREGPPRTKATNRFNCHIPACQLLWLNEHIRDYIFTEFSDNDHKAEIVTAAASVTGIFKSTVPFHSPLGWYTVQMVITV